MIDSRKPLITAKGIGGQLELYDDKVVIKRDGALAFMAHGLKGNKEIFISQISSIQFRKAGMVNGFIQFAFLGGYEAKGALFQATLDENTVVFNTWQQKPFIEIKEALDRMLSSRGNQQPVADIGDLEKLAALRDRGIISAADFEAKKRQILGI